MAEIYQFPIKKDSDELFRLKNKLKQLKDLNETTLREMRVTADLIKLIENGEPKNEN